MLLSTYWGSASTPSSLCHLKELVCRQKVDQKGKVFNIADEFIHHTFSAHLLLNIMPPTKISSPLEPFNHENTKEWLLSTAV